MVADHEKRSRKLSVQNRLHNIAMFFKVKDFGQLKKSRKGVREETGCPGACGHVLAPRSYYYLFSVPNVNSCRYRVMRPRILSRTQESFLCSVLLVMQHLQKRALSAALKYLLDPQQFYGYLKLFFTLLTRN